MAQSFPLVHLREGSGAINEFARFVLLALGGLIGRQVTEVLPALKTIFVDGLQSPDPSKVDPVILQFVAARHRFGRTVGLPFQGRRKLMVYV